MPLTPTDPRCLVGGQPLTGFDADTRQQLQPRGLTAARVLRFPGSATGFAVKGVATPPPIIVTGVLRADSYDALYTLIADHNAWVASTGIVTVRLHETDFNNCTPMRFELTGQPTTYLDGETKKARVTARFIFEQLQG